MHNPADKKIADIVRRCHTEAKRLNASARPSVAGALLEEAATNLRLLAMKIERLEGSGP